VIPGRTDPSSSGVTTLPAILKHDVHAAALSIYFLSMASNQSTWA
jgi:hypothetical protein